MLVDEMQSSKLDVKWGVKQDEVCRISPSNSACSNRSKNARHCLREKGYLFSHKAQQIFAAAVSSCIKLTSHPCHMIGVPNLVAYLNAAQR